MLKIAPEDIPNNPRYVLQNENTPKEMASKLSSPEFSPGHENVAGDPPLSLHLSKAQHKRRIQDKPIGDGKY